MKKYVPWVLIILAYLSVLAEFFVGLFTGNVEQVWILFFIGFILMFIGTTLAVKQELKQKNKNQ